MQKIIDIHVQALVKYDTGITIFMERDYITGTPIEGNPTEPGNYYNKDGVWYKSEILPEPYGHK